MPCCSYCVVFSSVVTTVINGFIAIARDICFKASRVLITIWLEIMDCSEQNSKHWVKLNNVKGSVCDRNTSLGKTQPLLGVTCVASKHACGFSCVSNHLPSQSPQWFPKSDLSDWRWWSSSCSVFSVLWKSCTLFTVGILAAARPWNDSVCQQAG